MVAVGQFTRLLLASGGSDVASISVHFVYVRSSSGVLGGSTGLGMSGGHSLGITGFSQRDARHASHVTLQVFSIVAH